MQHKLNGASKAPGEIGYLRNAQPERWDSVPVPVYREAGEATWKPADDESETTILVDEPWPALPHEDAFHGVAGDIVRLIEPHSEADPVALLLQLLVVMGNIPV